MKTENPTEALVRMLEESGAKIVTQKTVEEKREELKKIIIFELKRLPDTVRMMVCEKSYDKFQLIEGIKKENKIGKFMIKMKENYIKEFKK